MFSMTFTYRWYESSSDADRVLQPGQCPSGFVDGCKKLSKIGQENADRDLRYAMAAFVVALVSGATAVFIIRRESEPAAMSDPPHVPSKDVTDPSERLRRLDAMKADGLVTDGEYDDKRRDILGDL